MNVALSRQAADCRDGRRLHAWELSEAGWSKIAEALGVSSGPVSHWIRRVREGGGPEALRKRKAPGAKCRPSERDRLRLLELLRQGAKAHSFKYE